MMNVESTRKSLQLLATDLSELRSEICDVISNSDFKLTLVADKLDVLERKVNNINTGLCASKNGRLLWRIDNISELLTRAISKEKDFCVCSDFLYTGEYGYKLQFRLYLNGKGAGEDTHLSLYVFIYKSEHDILLEWPFLLKVKIILLDLNEVASKRTHHFVTVGRDRDTSSFARPVREHNPGWGFPTFVSHEDLMGHSFIRENRIFMKLIVEPYDAVVGYTHASNQN